MKDFRLEYVDAEPTTVKSSSPIPADDADLLDIQQAYGIRIR